MNAQEKFLTPTTRSTSPVFSRIVCPYSEVNPQSNAHNVIAIVESVFFSPPPDGYTEIADVIRENEKDAAHAAAIQRARVRLAGKIELPNGRPTLAYLRLKAGFSQEKIAELLGNSQSGYSLIESGKRTDIFWATFENLAAVLNVTRDQLAEALKNTQEKAS